MATEGQIDEEDLNVSRNMTAMFECAPFPYILLIIWTWEKLCNETIEEFVIRKDILTHNNIKGRDAKSWWKRNGQKIKSNNMTGWDVTFLHEFLPMVCERKFMKPGGQDYEVKIRDTNSVEYLLKTIKELRNNVCHVRKNTVSQNVVANLQDLIKKCVEKGGQDCGRQTSEIIREISIIESVFRTIKNRTYTLKEKKQFIRDIMLSRCNEFLENELHNFRMLLPGYDNNLFDIHEMYCEVNLSQTYNSDNIGGRFSPVTKNEFSSSQLGSLTQKFNIIGAESGSGKTTIMRMFYRNLLHELRDDVLDKINNSRDDAQKYTLPVYIECRTVTCDNLEDFLIDTFSKKLGITEVDDLMNAFTLLGGVKFLIDGYDEINEKSRKLVESVIDYCLDERRKNVQCIVTARVQASNDFAKLVQRKSSGFADIGRFRIERITDFDSKLRFIRKYEELYAVPADAFLTQMNNQKPSVLGIFSSPMLIAVFCSLCFDANKSKTEIILTDSTRVYEAFYRLFRKNIELKLSICSRTCDLTEASQTIMDLLCQYSFKLFREQKYYLTVGDYENLVESCMQNNLPYSDIESALTCVLSPELSIRGDESYQFYHASIQEFLAAKWAIKNIEQHPIESQKADRQDRICECFGGELEGENNMNRYGIFLLIVISI